MNARRPSDFKLLLAYGLANAGGTIAYLPLLTLLVPLKVALIAPTTRMGLLASLSLAGALAASASNVLWGWLSDRTVAAGGSRRGWILFGTLFTCFSYVGIWAASSAAALIAAVILCQIALNALLSPLAALMADEVPDARKGIAGGLLTFANPAAAAAGALVVASGDYGELGRLALICLLFSAAVLPLLLITRQPVERAACNKTATPRRRRNLVLAWTARLLMQVSGVVLFGFALFYFQSVTRAGDAGRVDAWTSAILTLSYIISTPAAVLTGFLSDRFQVRGPFLVAAATLAATGLAIMANADTWWPAAAGFATFICGNAIFLGLNTAHAMQLLPSSATRGRDLGLVNLANTLPSLIGPGLTWLLATSDDFRTLFLILAGFALAAGTATLLIRES